MLHFIVQDGHRDFFFFAHALWERMVKVAEDGVCPQFTHSRDPEMETVQGHIILGKRID